MEYNSITLFNNVSQEMVKNSLPETFKSKPKKDLGIDKIFYTVGNLAVWGEGNGTIYELLSTSDF